MSGVRRAHVKKLDKPVICKGQSQPWEYSVPLRTGTLIGWRATQNEALHKCLELLREKKLRGWT